MTSLHQWAKSSLAQFINMACYPFGANQIQYTEKWWRTGLIRGLRPANERRRYFVTTSLIGWAQTYNHPGMNKFDILNHLRWLRILYLFIIILFCLTLFSFPCFQITVSFPCLSLWAPRWPLSRWTTLTAARLPSTLCLTTGTEASSVCSSYLNNLMCPQIVY